LTDRLIGQIREADDANNLRFGVAIAKYVAIGDRELHFTRDSGVGTVRRRFV
jgi:hypothetical protein